MESDDTLTRVLAITGNHSLVIGLTFLGRPWDVSSRSDVDGPFDADVLVVDLGTTQAAIDALAPRSERPPAVIVGIEPVKVAKGDRFLPRPFTLDDLADSVELLTSASAAPPVPAPEPTPAAAGPWVATRPPSDAKTRAEATTATGSSPKQVGQAGYWVLPGWTVRDDRPLVDAAQGRIPERTTATSPAADPSGGEATASADPAASDASARTTPAQPDEDDPHHAAGQSAAGHGAVGHGADGHAAAVRDADDDAAGGGAATETADEDIVIDVRTDEADPDPVVARPARTIDLTDHDPAPRGRSGLQRLRSLATRSRDSKPMDPRLRHDQALQRFARGVTAGSEIESLLADMPVLRSMRSLAQGIVEEVHRELDADTTAFWHHFEDGFRVIASRGLTRNEQRFVAALDQPLLGEVEASGGGLLIDPVEAAQAAVAGIGGAHTESFMAASIAIGDGRYGLLAVGRNRPLKPPELDKLIALATEAAPGVAIAELIRRLGSQVVTPAVDKNADIFADERTQEQARFSHSRA